MKFWPASFLLLSPAILFAQTFRLSSATASAGEEVLIHLSLQSPSNRSQPAALQWEIELPSGQLSFAKDSASPGPAAEAAGKSVNCAPKTSSAGVQTAICILYGGLEPIHDGVVAIFRLQVSTDAPPGPAKLKLDRAVAVLKDLAKTPMQAVETTVKVVSK